MEASRRAAGREDVQRLIRSGHLEYGISPDDRMATAQPCACNDLRDRIGGIWVARLLTQGNLRRGSPSTPVLVFGGDEDDT
jgi:hypothetical protein